MKKNLVLGASLLVLTATAGPSFAQGSTAQRAACTPDVFKLCSGDIPNVTKITACLRRERSSLSSGCSAVFDTLDRPQTATRSLSATRVDGPTRWCEFGTNPLPGQDVWVAWCTDAN